MVVLSVVLCGCEAEPEPNTGASSTMIGAVAAQQSRTRLVFADATAKDRVSELLAGDKPTDFHWIMFEVDTAAMERVRSSEGLSADLSDSAANVSFSQVYPGPCNPALDRFDKCLLYERLISGSTGVTGRVSLKLGELLDASYDVSMEGTTDRFGEPLQWHKHGSIGNVSARVPGVP